MCDTKKLENFDLLLEDGVDDDDYDPEYTSPEYINNGDDSTDGINQPCYTPKNIY